MTGRPTSMRRPPTLLDIHFGRRLRLRRELLEADRALVARLVGRGEQEVADLEDGRRGFDAALLQRLGKVLEVPVTWFYDGLGGAGLGEDEGQASTESPMRDRTLAAPQAERRRQGQILLAYFDGLNDHQQAAVLDIARLLSLNGNPADRHISQY